MPEQTPNEDAPLCECHGEPMVWVETKPVGEHLERINAAYDALREAKTETVEAIEEAVFDLDLDFAVPVFPEVPEDPKDATKEDWDAIVEYWDAEDHTVGCTGYAVTEVLETIIEAENLTREAVA